MVEGETSGKHDGHSGDEAAAKRVYTDKILNSIEHNYVLLHIMYCLWGGFREGGENRSSAQLSSVVLCGYIKLVGVSIKMHCNYKSWVVRY